MPAQMVDAATCHHYLTCTTYLGAYLILICLGRCSIRNVILSVPLASLWSFQGRFCQYRAIRSVIAIAIALCLPNLW